MRFCRHVVTLHKNNKKPRLLASSQAKRGFNIMPQTGIEPTDRPLENTLFFLRACYLLVTN